jgi:hypothetical protein
LTGSATLVEPLPNRSAFDHEVKITIDKQGALKIDWPK